VDCGEAARVLGVTPSRVRQIAGQGHIPGAVRYGVSWLIPLRALREFARHPRPLGRPPKVLSSKGLGAHPPS